MATNQCDTCGKSLGTLQPDMFGGPQQCIECLTNARISMMLNVLPDEQDDLAWEHLSEYTQSFLTSVRKQFHKKGTLSEKQYQVLEKIWKANE